MVGDWVAASLYILLVQADPLMTLAIVGYLVLTALPRLSFGPGMLYMMVMVALAYGLPLYAIVQQQGLFGNGVGTYPVVIELLRGHLPVGLVEFVRHFPTTALDATVGLLEVVR